MTRFNTKTAVPAAPLGAVRTTGPMKNHAGGTGFQRDAKGELFMLAVTYMGSEKTFYEGADTRDDRFRTLVRTVAVEDGEWLGRFIPWLRGSANMRTASLVAAAEAVKARGAAGLHNSRQYVNAALQRADEPGEFLAYWMANYGRNLPAPVKRGVADAVGRLYTEFSLLKYDTESHAVRFGDVIDLVHPHPYLTTKGHGTTAQGELFEYALNRRHNRDDTAPESLPMLRQREALAAMPVKDRRKELLSPGGAARLNGAGMTWEALAGWLQGPMDAAAWEAIIPNMGYMALLRNLRNFDEAKVSDKVAAQVCARLADPDQVAKSKQFPYRFLSAYAEAPSLRWAHALETALGHACANIPDLPGRTLVLIDTSGSMGSTVSSKSRIRHVDIAALIGMAIARKCGPKNVDLVGFASGAFRFAPTKGGSLLRDIDAFVQKVGSVGHGTETVAALKGAWGGQDRVVLVSDMQAFGYPGGSGYYDVLGRIQHTSVSDSIPAHVPMFSINTAGYASAGVDTSKPGRYEIGGFSDKVFTMLSALSSGDMSWPF